MYNFVVRTASRNVISTNRSILAQRHLPIFANGFALSLEKRYGNERIQSQRQVARLFSTTPPNSSPFTKAPNTDNNETNISSPLTSTTTLNEAPRGRFRELWHNYGVVFLGLYGSIYLVTLGTIYELVTLRHINAHNVIQFAHSLGVDNYIDLTPIAASKAGNFALAWILTKFTEPIRLAFTVTITPTVARFLGRAPPKPPKPVKDVVVVANNNNSNNTRAHQVTASIFLFNYFHVAVVVVVILW